MVQQAEYAVKRGYRDDGMVGACVWPCYKEKTEMLDICAGTIETTGVVKETTIGEHRGRDCRRVHYIERPVSTAVSSVWLVKWAGRCANLSARYPVDNRPTKEPALAIDTSVYTSLAETP